MSKYISLKFPILGRRYNTSTDLISWINPKQDKPKETNGKTWKLNY